MRRGVGLLGMLVLLLVGCAGAPEQLAGKPVQYWPEPPDLPRYRHVATLDDGNAIRSDLDEQSFRQAMTGQKLLRKPLPKPFSLAAGQGRLYISDTAINRVHVFDFPRRRYFQLGFRLEGELSKVRGIALDGQGLLYAVDRGGPRVVKYDTFGLYLGEIAIGAEVVRPSGVAVTRNGSRVFVVDTGGVDSQSHRVVAYDADGHLVAMVGDRGAAPGQFNLPVDAVVGADGLLYVLDSGNFRVQVFDQELNFVRSWGEVGKGFGQFARPRSIAVDSDGNVYVSDAQFANVQLFSPQGELLMALGKRGVKPGELELVSGVAVDELGHLYVADQHNHKVEVYRRLSEVEGRQALAEYRQRLGR
ncbi:6-bladed beta-propeller [Motiliproteus sediminis]|uniref:6-bladed beta-propeller n=1 Tax=Motiliproteus sediminis TaxID=1468178 RepID=UPI001AEFC66E|nr:6-bladed beta-propeller [Motiliproteus sediminis]